jgi:hypothetical protein
MKNFILGCLFVLLTSATVTQTDLLTIKPATPKSVVTKVTRYGTETYNFINLYVKKGYIVKSTHGDGSGNWLIIMEKY